MKTSDLLTHLGNRLEDSAEDNFSSTSKKSALDQASHVVANLLDWSFLGRLEVLTDSLTLVGGVVSFIDAFGSVPPLRNGIKRVYVDALNGSSNIKKYADSISHEDQSDNAYFTNQVDTVSGSIPVGTYQPVFWLKNESINVKPYDTGTTIRVEYFREPYKHFSISGKNITTVASANTVQVVGEDFSDLSKGQLIDIAGTDLTDAGRYTIASISSDTITVDEDIGADVATSGGDCTINSVDDLGSNLDSILLDYAEHLLWVEDNKPERGAPALQSALNQINTLNARV